MKSRLLVVDRDKGQLTVGKVNVFGYLVPGSVVKMADLLLVLHHVSWFASFLVLHGNVILDCFKVFPVLQTREAERRAGDKDEKMEGLLLEICEKKEYFDLIIKNIHALTS